MVEWRLEVKLKRIFILRFLFLLVLQAGLVFSGIEWQAKNITKTGDKEENVFLSLCYAQNGNVREEFVETGKKSDPFRKKGGYWIYRSGTETITIVDPEEKTYMEIDMNKILQIGGAVAKFIKMSITNPTVEVEKLGSENFGQYKCNHILIKSSYDIETKIAILKTKSHVEETKELWATEDIPSMEVAGGFQKKSFKTGIDELDTLIEKEMKAQKDLGFVIKSITTQKNINKKGKTETTVMEMTVSNVTFKNLPEEIFKVPAGYKKVEFPGMEE